MRESVQEFYDDLARDYHLIFEDWYRSIEWQGEVLSQLIRSQLSDSRINGETI